jgi:hypothetical protein
MALEPAERSSPIEVRSKVPLAVGRCLRGKARSLDFKETADDVDRSF